jgi:hypothetical protein
MSLEDAAARARHDLGKYVCFSARWLDAGVATEELRTALVDDLRRTRRGPTGEVGAAELWAELRPPLLGHTAEIDALFAELTPLAAGLDTLDRADLDRAAALARAVADALKQLHLAVRGR